MADSRGNGKADAAPAVKQIINGPGICVTVTLIVAKNEDDTSNKFLEENVLWFWCLENHFITITLKKKNLCLEIWKHHDTDNQVSLWIWINYSTPI